MIVNVIEPDHGTVFDPAFGSGGMFVQSSHFIEDEGQDTARRESFFGQEKNLDTIRIAKMNLAVHGLDGKIAEASSATCSRSGAADGYQTGCRGRRQAAGTGSRHLGADRSRSN